ncbi:MAG: hypothetical protein ACO3S5_08330 [Ilumatobacteraceae bacterium]
MELPGRHTITATIETITPQAAQQYLANQTRNRPVKKLHVARLAADMQAGRWDMTGEAIKFNGSTLIDGQHRLRACVESGCEFTTLVVRGLNTDAAKVMDIGVKRGVSDAIRMFGDDQLPNTVTVAACARLIMSLRLRPDNPIAAYSIVTHAEIVAEIESNVDKYNDAARYGLSFKAWGSSTAAAALAILATESGYSYEQLRRYYENINFGVGLAANDPCLTYRNWISKRPMRARVDAWTYLSAHVKCFGAFTHGRTLQKLYTWTGGSTPFPTLESAA